MFQLAGYSEADSHKAADQVMQFETALAKATLDNVARRDPQAIDHQTTYAQLQQLTPHFDWDGYYKGANLPRINLNVQEPKFMEEVDRQLSTTTLPDWKIYFTWQLLHGSAPFLSQPFVQENFNFYEKTLGGVGELKPRWKQCAESADQFLGEALGRDYAATADQREFAPALFTFLSTYAAAVHADGVYVGKPNLLPGADTRPARPGETILLFGTGFGPTDPPLPASQVVTQAAVLANPITVRIGGIAADVAFAGLTGSGLVQFNVTLPDLPDGDAPVVIEIAGVPTQAGVSITVQR